MEELQEVQEEKKSYGKKKRGPLSLFLLLLPLLFTILVFTLVYRYGKKVIQEREANNALLAKNGGASFEKQALASSSEIKDKEKEELHILLLSDGLFRKDAPFLTVLQEKAEKELHKKIQFEDAGLPENATALSAYLYLMERQEKEKFDLVLFSFGEQDDPYTFPYYYELLLKTLVEKYPNTALLPVISYQALLPDGHSKDNAMLVQNLCYRYGIEALNLAQVLAEEEQDPGAVLGEEDTFSRFEKKYFSSALLSAMENAKPGTEGSHVNPILDGVRECIPLPKALWKEAGSTTLLLSEEELEKLSLKGRHGMFALSSVFHEGENQGTVYVDGIPEAYYSLSGKAYLGILTGDVMLRKELILQFSSEEEKNNFKALYFLSPIPLEKGMKNGQVLPHPEIQAVQGEDTAEESSAQNQASSSENPEVDATVLPDGEGPSSEGGENVR